MHPGARNVLIDRTLRVALLGVIAGTCAGLADLGSALPWLPRGWDRLRLGFAVLALGAAAGALGGALLGALDALLARGVRTPWRRHALVLAGPLAWVATQLFTGGMMRRLPAKALLVPLAWVTLLAGATVVVSLGRSLGARYARAARGARVLAGATCAGLGLALHTADHRVLPRLYEYLHAGLGVLGALAFATAAVCLVPALPRTRRVVAGAIAVLAVALGAVAEAKLETWPNVRAGIFGAHAPFARHVVLAVTAVRPPTHNPLGDPAAIRRAQAALGGARANVRGMPVRHLAHLLLVTVDALRADRLGRVVDGRSLTPNLDALAAGSTVFARAITQAPHSSYAISSLHTGEYLHETIPLGQRQPLATIASTLRARGWNTSALYTNGIFFTEGERLLPYRDTNLGFARASHVDREARGQTDAAIAEIDEAARRGGPSFVWVHYFDVHAPYGGQGETPVARYDDAVRVVDREAARLIAHARRALRGDLVIALTADHGEEFGEHGGIYHGSTLYEEQLRVPLVVHVPGHPPRRVPGHIGAQLVDLAPTLVSLLGVDPAASMRGNDLRRWMTDAPTDDPPPVFAAVNTRRAVVRWPWKLVVDLTYGVEELIDLSADPLERRNRAAEAVVPRAELRALLGAWIADLAARADEPPAVARGRLGDREAIPGLLVLARDARTPTARRVECLELLARFGTARIRDELAPLLGDGEARVRHAAAVALGNARDARAAPILRDLAAGEDPVLRARAAIALARLGNAAGLDALVDALASRDEEICLEAVKSLGALRDRRAVDPLLAALADDHLRYRAVISLGEIGDPRAFEALHAIARRDPTDDAQTNATLALGLLGDQRALPLLRERLTAGRDPPVVAGALVALGAVGRDVRGFDAARFVDAPLAGFARCARHEDGGVLGHLGLRGCDTGSVYREVTVPLTGVVAPAAAVLLRARRDEGPAVMATVFAGARTLGTVNLTARWETLRVEGDPQGEPITLRLESPAVVHLAHLVVVPR